MVRGTVCSDWRSILRVGSWEEAVLVEVTFHNWNTKGMGGIDTKCVA